MGITDNLINLGVNHYVCTNLRVTSLGYSHMLGKVLSQKLLQSFKKSPTFKVGTYEL